MTSQSTTTTQASASKTTPAKPASGTANAAGKSAGGAAAAKHALRGKGFDAQEKSLAPDGFFDQLQAAAGKGDLWSSIGDGLRAIDRALMGSGEKSNLHGDRLTSTSDDAAYQGTPIHGHAHRDLNVDLLLAIANAKGMHGSVKDLSRFPGLRGKSGLELLEAIAETVEVAEELIEKIEELLEALEVDAEKLGPGFMAELKQMLALVRGFRAKTKKPAAKKAPPQDGPEHFAKHPNEAYVKERGWVPKKDLVIEHDTGKASNVPVEKVVFADGKTFYAKNGKPVPNLERELAYDPYLFAGGITVRSVENKPSGAKIYGAESLSKPAWVKR